jgi:antitoxin (DNA-binding transcriptional repressor) of toxin-antitoxin stability system
VEGAELGSASGADRLFCWESVGSFGKIMGPGEFSLADTAEGEVWDLGAAGLGWRRHSSDSTVAHRSRKTLCAFGGNCPQAIDGVGITIFEDCCDWERRMIESMEHDVVHVSSAEAIRDIAAILERVERGAEVIVEKGERAVALIQPAPRPGRLLSECIALAKAHEEKTGHAPTLDEGFAHDLEEIIAGRRESLESRWD